MAERNMLLIGQAVEIDPLLPAVRAMIGRQGLYLASDTEAPGRTVPLVVTGDEVWSIQLDARLDPARFKRTIQIAGPFYAPGEEQVLEFSGSILVPCCPFCAGPPKVSVVLRDQPDRAAPIEQSYGDDGLVVEGYVYCLSCGAAGPKYSSVLRVREDYARVERAAIHCWSDRNSRYRLQYDAGLLSGYHIYPGLAGPGKESGNG